MRNQRGREALPRALDDRLPGSIERRRAQTLHSPKSQRGFTLVEMLVAVVTGAFLVATAFRMLTANQRTADLIANKGDLRDRATLATTQVNRTLTMAGFGITRMDVVFRKSGSLSDTILVWSNPSERRTTLIDSAPAGTEVLRVFKDSGFTVGGFLGITDSLNHEYSRVIGVSGDSINGFRIKLSGGISNSFAAGVPDIYPVQKERIFADPQQKALIRYVDDRRQTLGEGITSFRTQFLNVNGTAAAAHKDIRVITFSLTGSFKAPAGANGNMSFSSTVIPRNIL